MADGLMPEQFVYHGPPKVCPQCGEMFMPNTVRQIYCSRSCNERAKYERRVKLRKKKGLCPQCGGELVLGEPKKTGRNAGNPPSYCIKCQEYFSERRKGITKG
jgi:ribosomal protein S27AE